MALGGGLFPAGMSSFRGGVVVLVAALVPEAAALVPEAAGFSSVPSFGLPSIIDEKRMFSIKKKTMKKIVISSMFSGQREKNN